MVKATYECSSTKNLLHAFFEKLWTFWLKLGNYKQKTKNVWWSQRNLMYQRIDIKADMRIVDVGHPNILKVS